MFVAHSLLGPFFELALATGESNGLPLFFKNLKQKKALVRGRDPKGVGAKPRGLVVRVAGWVQNILHRVNIFILKR